MLEVFLHRTRRRCSSCAAVGENGNREYIALFCKAHHVRIMLEAGTLIVKRPAKTCVASIYIYTNQVISLPYIFITYKTGAENKKSVISFLNSP